MLSEERNSSLSPKPKGRSPIDLIDGVVELSALTEPSGAVVSLRCGGALYMCLAQVGSRVGDLFVSLQGPDVEPSSATISEGDSEDDLSFLRTEVTLYRGENYENDSIARACALVALAATLDNRGDPWGPSSTGRIWSAQQAVEAISRAEAWLPIEIGGTSRWHDDDSPKNYMELWSEKQGDELVFKLCIQQDIDTPSFGFCLRAPGLLGGGRLPRLRNGLMVLAQALLNETQNLDNR